MVRQIVIFGPQGSGKGTQAELLAAKLGLVYISTGNIFRQEIDNQTAVGLEAQVFIKDGKLVPDTLTNTIVASRLKQDEVRQRGYILDGYPRNREQFVALSQVSRVTDAIVIDISDREAIFRIGGRCVCVCGQTYHTTYHPPKMAGLCDACGKALFVREDDKPEAIRQRLATYHAETEPLFTEYEGEGVLKRVNGEKSIPEVQAQVLRALGIT